jgi:hypothetical protein
MKYTPAETVPFATISVHADPSRVGTWLTAALRRLTSRSAATPAPGNREREAAEVRAFAESVRRTDPGFAADLFAAADRHEMLGM